MISLPDQNTLVRHVCDALQEVASGLPPNASASARTRAIGDALERRLDDPQQGIECAFGYKDALGKKKIDSSKEWLFDFCALLVDPPDRKGERYTMQALVVGEIEWHNNLGLDFEKLLVTDAPVCFFAFLKSVGTKEHDAAYFLALAHKRRRYVALRGTAPLPVFIIASYEPNDRRFALLVTE